MCIWILDSCINLNVTEIDILAEQAFNGGRYRGKWYWFCVSGRAQTKGFGFCG
jgi:hypothetical protein